MPPPAAGAPQDIHVPGLPPRRAAGVTGPARRGRMIRTPSLTPGALLEPDDDELLRRAGCGEAAAFERLASRHDTALLRFALRTCGDAGLAEDAVQEALLSAWRGARDFRGDASVRAWLFGIALHACRRVVRRRAGEPARLETLDAAGGAAGSAALPDEAAARAELGRALDAALLELDAGAREILLLRDVEQLSGEEVARLLDLGLPAMKSRLHRARLELKGRVEARLGWPAGGRHG